MTYTYVLMEVSPAVYLEIREKLLKAGYDHAITSEGELDLHGIALVQEELTAPQKPAPGNLPGLDL